jgi:flagellar biosynthetic protein FlhB
MADETSDAEKKHAPTAERLRKAREQGQIKRSADLPKAAGTMFFVLAVASTGGAAAGYIEEWFGRLLLAAGSGGWHDTRNLVVFFSVAFTGFLTLAFLIAMGFGSITGGWMLSVILASPKLSRITPGSGFGQVFSMQNLIEVLKSIVKIIAIGGAGIIAFIELRPEFVAMASPAAVSLTSLGGPTVVVIGSATVAASVVAAVDVWLQAWLQRRTLRMTDQELRDEMKNAEGDPHVKAKRRAAIRKMSKARQTRAVRTASVIVTNPTHFAVAIRYRKGIDPVPHVVAKGVDLNAASIIEEARIHGVPLVEAPPVARALHRFVEVDQPVPLALYRACAEILAYIWRLEMWRRGQGNAPNRPQFAADFMEGAAIPGRQQS